MAACAKSCFFCLQPLSHHAKAFLYRCPRVEPFHGLDISGARFLMCKHCHETLDQATIADIVASYVVMRTYPKMSPALKLQYVDIAARAKQQTEALAQRWRTGVLN